MNDCIGNPEELLDSAILSPWSLLDLEGLGSGALDGAAAARPREGRASELMTSVFSGREELRKNGQWYPVAPVSPAGIVRGPRCLIDAGGLPASSAIS